MSRIINLNELNDEDLKKIGSDLQITQPPSKYAFSSLPKYLYLYELKDNDKLIVPFSYGNCSANGGANGQRPNRDTLGNINIKFTGQLREEQKEIKTEAIQHLNKYGSTIISAYCGFGKTITSIYIATKIGLKTLIVCHRIVLINQWKESIEKFTEDAKIQIIEGDEKINKDCDFYIINAINIPKRNSLYYKDIGTLIVDESHILLAEKMCLGLKYIFPRYVIGLSATPYRMDGLNILFDLYFGDRKITRKLYRRHIVYKVMTGFKPEVKTNRMGKVDWNSVLNSQCEDEKRNELIIDIIKKYKERVFLILCKRVIQANYIVKRLTEEKEDVTSLIGSEQKYEQSSRILVGTVSKVGVGFDHPRVNTLLIASDVEQYFVQYLGRVFRVKNSEPYIFDLVDNYGLLEKHFKTRMGVYIEHGGIIKKYE